MKKVIERIRTAPLLAVLIALAAGGAGASVTADAVWEGGFTDGSTKTGASGITYTLNLRGNTSNATGATLPITTAMGAQIALSASSPNLAVLVKYSALNAAPTKTYELAAIRVKDKGWPGLRVASANGYGITGFYEASTSNDYGFSITPKLSSTGGYFLLCHQGGSQTGGYAGSTLQQLSGGTTTSLKWGTGGTTLDIIVLGGPSATGLATSAYSGLVIEKVAIFNQVVTGADLATYAFPSEDPATTYDYTATISANTTFSDITWTTGTGTPGTDAKVYIEAQNNAVLTIGGTFDVGALWVNGGSIAFDTGTTVSSTKIVGAPINIATETVNFSDSFLASAINTTGACTINFTDCEIYGGITAAKNGGAAINTYGNVVFGDIADNYFKYGTTFCVKSGGTTTYNSKSDRKLWCTVRVEKDATLINERQDSFDYYSDPSWPIHAYIYGTLTLNQKWTVGKCARYIHLYDGALINGSAANALHSNISGYACDFIAEKGTSTITAPFVKGEGTINVVTKENAMLVLSTSQALAKSGAGTLRIKNTDLTSDISGSEGVLELYNDSGSNKAHSGTISFSGTIKATRENSSNSHNAFGTNTENTTTTGQDLILTGMPKLVVAGSQAYLCLNAQLANQNLSVKNLTYEGDVSDAKVDPVFNGGTSTGDMAQIKTIKTKQTEDTICNLIFNGESNRGKRQSALYVYGDTDAVHSLTLTKESITFGPLTVENYGKVIFSGSGKWANGTVTVGVNGVLEAQHTAALGVVTLQDGATIVVPTVLSAVVPLTGTTVTLPTSGTVNVDLTGVTVAEGESVTVISATSLVNANASIFRQTEGGWRFSVDNNTIKARKLGTATWSDGTWSDSDLTGYASASITASGTQDVTLPTSATFDTLTITGSGTVSFSSTDSETISVSNISIPAGVTVNTADGMEISGDVSGGGVINVPANTTLTMDGVTTSGDTLADRVKVTVSGTLKTKGTTTLSAANTSAAGSLIEVVNGVTTLSSLTCGLSGNITIQSDGELKFAASYNASGADQGWDYLGTSSSNTVKVYGTLNMSDHNLWLRANNTLELYQGAEVLGSGTYASYYGSLIWAGNASLMAYGDAEINATITTLTDCSPVFNVAENKTLTISTAFIGQAVEITANPTRISGGSITKAGAGTLDLTAITPTKPITINAGTVLAATAPTTAVVNKNGVLNLTSTSSKDDRSTNLSGITGSGTIRYSGSSWRALPKTSSNFFADTLSVELEQVSGVVCSAQDTVIGSISGGKNLRTDLENYKVNDITIRTVTVKQAKDGTWEGKFTDDRLKTFIVMGGADSTGTLTLTATFTETDEMNVAANGSVKLADTCTWKGDVTVSGEFGGTGSIDGGLTLNAGSTFKVWTTDANGLAVSGALTLPATGSVTVDVTAIADAIAASGATGVPLISSSSIKAATNVSMIECENAVIKAEEGAIKAYPVATVTTSGSGAVVAYSSVQEAINNAKLENDQYVTAYQSETVTATGYILLKIDGGAVVILNSSKAGYAYDVGTSIGEGIYMFSDSVQVAATFKWKTAVASGSWGTTANWTSDDGTVSRIPGSLDTVIFESAALVETPVSGFSFAALQANASVTIKRDQFAIGEGLTRTVSAYGAISGTGSLTLNDGVNLANASDASLSIGVPVTVAGATALTVAEGVAASFTGSGTLTLDAFTSTSIVGDGWTGTVWLKNISSGNIVPANYGNANSVIKFTGVTGEIPTGTTCSSIIELVDDGATKALTIDFTSESAFNTITLSELKGDGTFALKSTAGYYPRTTFKISKWDAFEGSLNVDRGRIQFGNDTISNDEDYLHIRISSGASVDVATGKTWTATQGFRVYGTLNAVTPDNLTGKLVGSGRVELGSLRSSAFTFDTWTGTVVLPAISTTPDQGHRLDYYGKAGSTIEIDKGFSGWLNASSDDTRNVKANLLISNGCQFTIVGTNSGTTYGFAKISGNGNFHLRQTNQPNSFTIGMLDGYSGTIVNDDDDGGTPTTLTIQKVKLAAAPTPGDKLVGTTTPDALTVATTGESGVYVGNTQQSVTLAKGSDGIYAALVSVTKGGNPTTYYATVSDAMTAAGSDAATITLLGNTDSNVSLAVGQSLVTGGFSVGTVSTSAENYHVVNNAGVYTVVLDTYTITIPSVANTTVSVDYVKDGAAANATTAGNITVDAGTSLTATWTAASGYRITAGASQTINPVAAAQTLAEPTVVANAVTFTGYTVEYTADYSKAATISATVSGEGAEGATYTLTAGGNNYNGTYNAGTVTFSNITAPSLGSELSYTISASGAASGTSGAQTETVGNVTSGWVQEDATHNESTGTWETDIAYSDGVATITDNTYTPTKPGNGIVTLETVVKFGNEADPEVAVGDGAQAAVKIANGQFAVYGKATSDGTAGWQSTEVAAEVDATYTVKLVINYNTRTFTISVKKNGAETATPLGSAWHLATVATKVSSIAYKGTGGFTSLTGSFISGDVGVTVDETNVAVSSDFIGRYLGTKTVSEATELLAPNSTATCSNGYNYFKCYALGLDPTKADDKPIVDVTVVDGNYVFKVKHPVYNEQGEIIGYEEINAADNVSTTVTLKYGTDASSITTVEKGAASGISPADMFDHAGAGNVLYYKAEVTIGAK